MTKNLPSKSGAVLVIAMVMLVAFTLLVATLLQAGSYNNSETEQQIRETQAFWIAEEGKERAYAQFKKTGSGCVNGDTPDFASGRKGHYHVTDEGENVFTSTGTLTVGDITNTRSIQFEIVSLYAGYEDLIHAPKQGDPWTFLLGGSNDPVRSASWSNPPRPGQTERGGPDQAYGNIYLGTGSVSMNGESSVNPAPAPNTHGFMGDVSIYDGTITTSNRATIAGTRKTTASAQDSPDLIGMNYSEIATHNLTDIFTKAKKLGRVTNGRLDSAYYPFLHNLVRQDGDNYYFETTTSRTIEQLNVGDACVFYADGDIWFDKSGPLQFNINGTATIVASGDIHIGDGLTYVDKREDGDLLALIALGTYNDNTNGKSGDIYFGDGFGTLYNVDAFMFAAHDFYYNYYNKNSPQEPNTGFSVLGNFVALNQLHIYRDWYGEYNNSKPALYVPGHGWKDAIDWEDDKDTPLSQDQIDGTKVWVPDKDSETGTELETGSWVEKTPGMRHYAMIMKYDERIFDPRTQPPCLPRGGGRIVNTKIVNWQHADGGN